MNTPSTTPTTEMTTKTNWNWVATRTTKTEIVKTYPEGKTTEEVHEKTEEDYPERTWDWTIDEKKREVRIFKNHWRVKEEEDHAKGKTQEQIWKEEAIGKCLRMARVHLEMFGSTLKEAKESIEFTKDCWIKNKMRGGCVAVGGRPPMTEAEARAEVEKAFADYTAEYGDEFAQYVEDNAELLSVADGGADGGADFPELSSEEE